MQSNLITPYLSLLANRSGSDLYFSTGARPKMMLDGRLRDIGNDIMDRSGMNETQASEFDLNGEVNFALSMEVLGRFRVNVFRQRGETSMVIRLIREVIPTLSEMGLPRCSARSSRRRQGRLRARSPYILAGMPFLPEMS
ncbi:MAG: hypothetical protein FNT29_08535 [Halothiobacillaceae bacterium]|nr:MAG: hypothetical protein FNT29_08535 [Halothiobacillaceae bacterium]